MPISLQPRPSIATLDEAHIATLVDTFYDTVRADDLIGPVFNAAIADWDEHKRLLTAFWCSVALRAASYRGNPLSKHKPLPIGREHFARWLALWHATVPEIMQPEAASVMIEFAERIGQGMRSGLGIGDPAHRDDIGVPMCTAQPRPPRD